jgi:anti-sigma28 factor (negative regulator of flagellin synthesis)
MDNKENQPAPPDNNNGTGRDKSPLGGRTDKNTLLSGNANLIENVRQIISETQEIRPEKVGPLQKAVEQGNYSIDVRKLANILITKIFLDS